MCSITEDRFLDPPSCEPTRRIWCRTQTRRKQGENEAETRQKQGGNKAKQKQGNNEANTRQTKAVSVCSSVPIDKQLVSRPEDGFHELARAPRVRAVRVTESTPHFAV